MSVYKSSFPWFLGIRKSSTFYKKALKISILVFIIELKAEKRNKDIRHSARDMQTQRDNIKNITK